MEFVHDKAKSEAWALTQNLTPPDTQDLWRDLRLALPMWDGSGRFVEDVSGLGLHSGTWGSTATWTRGELGPGLDFDATGTGYFQIPDPPADYLDGCGALTVEFWFIPHDVTALHGIVSKYRASVGMRGWRIYTSGTELYQTISQDGTAYLERGTSGAGITIGTLYHAVVEFDAGAFRVYLNGVLQSTTGNYTGYTSIYPGTDYLLMGKRYDGNYFNGTVFGLRIWQRALAAEEVAILYEAPFRMYEPAFDFLSWAVIHAGSTPAGEWELAGEVENDVEEFYLSGLENTVSYDVYATTVDLTGNESTGCAFETATPVGGTGGVYAPLHRGITVAPNVPPIVRRYR